MKKNEMGGACSMYWGGACRVLVGKVRERDHLEEPGIDRMMI